MVKSTARARFRLGRGTVKSYTPSPSVISIVMVVLAVELPERQVERTGKEENVSKLEGKKKSHHQN
jgi:hypothetical protein